MLDLTIYAIAGPQDYPTDSIEVAFEKMGHVIESGVTFFQYRDKGMAFPQLGQREQLVAALRAVAKLEKVTFIIDDDVKLALNVHADGIHVGQSDLALEKLVPQLPTDMILGLSINNLSEMTAVDNTRIDYLGLGPIFPTNSKADASASLGVEYASEILNANQLHLPVVGIGGIQLKDLPALKQTGLNGVAVISLLTQAQDVAATVSAMKESWQNA